MIYDENGRLRLEPPAPPNDLDFYPVSGAVLQGFVDQVNELRAERDRLKEDAPKRPEPCTAETWSWNHFTPDQVDPYWIRCTLASEHDLHQDGNTGLTWPKDI